MNEKSIGLNIFIQQIEVRDIISLGAEMASLFMTIKRFTTFGKADLVVKKLRINFIVPIVLLLKL
jgi:hypothetical protein